MAARCTAEGVGRQQYLLRLSELEFIYRHQRMMQRRITVTDGTGGKAWRLDPAQQHLLEGYGGTRTPTVM